MIVDHVLVDTVIRDHAIETLMGAFWVGVTCDVVELVRREVARGDRFLGFASGTSAVVHRGMTYHLVVDTTTTPSDVLAGDIYDAFMTT